VNFPAFKKLSAHLDNDVRAQPWLPFKKIGDLFVLNSYIGKSYIKMLGIYLSPQIYHHHKFTITTSPFDVKFKENNGNDMTYVVWAGTVFGPRLWQLSARRHSLAGTNTLCVMNLSEIVSPSN
jgi:hypothetical protein